MNLRELNGGFPEPPPNEPVRVVRATHRGCGGETRIRLSGYVPSRAVRRAVCGRCEQSFACEEVVEVEEVAGPDGKRRAERLPPAGSPVWRWVGIPVAAALVVAVLFLLQGDDESPPAGGGGAGEVERAPRDEGGGSAGGAGGAKFVTKPGFSLTLPPGWEKTRPRGGAAYTAAAVDGTADATLWIESAPELSFDEFEARTMDELRSLTGNAEVVERIRAPDDAGTVVRLRADTPEGSGVSAPYDVTLRAAGPFRYYLATTVQAGASPQAREGADLIHSSFVPEAESAGEIETGAPPGADAAP